VANPRNREDMETALIQAIKRSLAALQRDTATKEKECVTEYSLDYLNCSGRFGPPQILKAFDLRPKGSLCLYGPPGTGKTQFVEYLAATLGLPLIAKRASDLLSKYVGDNEKNIAAMFAEAESEEAILFLDEGDSFLRSRENASQEWEITKVNELLQQMERFPGIFIAATNLFKNLDPAALRRFTFKLKFQELSSDQRLRMFLVETGLNAASELPSADQLQLWREKLAKMPMLTAGDFATIKRQSILLNERLSPDEWLTQLSLECATKSQ
ncbi:MAG: ATP-binding protein, partial [Candidatus Nanopelagicales bacterium]